MSSIEELHLLNIPLQELSLATHGFSEQNQIGNGGFGTVYRGISEKHGIIAIKKLLSGGTQGDPQFKTEINLLSVYKHENIVKFIGFCDEDEQKILVTKYESNGSLDKHLSRPDLTWIQRLQICLDAARGLHYLHHQVGLQHRILHRDVKSSNILLDENWKAKISDFGLSRMGPANRQSTFLISNACGTFGYIDPDYMYTGYLTQKSDVYSFGIVLFEVLCGRLTRDGRYKDEREFLINLVKKYWGRKRIDEIILPDLRKQIKRSSLLAFSAIAYQCLTSGNERPTMEKVVEQLQKALDFQLAPSGSWRDDGDDDDALLQGQPGLLASSSQSGPWASLFQQWNYDVFISFIGEDTRQTLVNHLYSSLVHRGIHIYKDDNTIPQGEFSVNQSWINGIQASRIAIIILSKNYAFSSWCLDELALIMKNWKERDQIVWPVFYDLNPTDVRKQEKRYGQALAIHEGTSNKNKVATWREALTMVANLAGWRLADG